MHVNEREFQLQSASSFLSENFVTNLWGGQLVYWSSNQGNLLMLFFFFTDSWAWTVFRICRVIWEFGEKKYLWLLYYEICGKFRICGSALYCGLVLKAYMSSLLSVCRVKNISLGWLTLIIVNSLTCYTKRLKNCLHIALVAIKYNLTLFSVICIW